MNITIDPRLKLPLTRFLIAGTCCAVSFAAALLAKNYDDSLRKTLVERQKQPTPTNALKMQDAINDMAANIDKVKRMVPSETLSSPGEVKIIHTLDQLSDLFVGAEIRPESLEIREEQIMLPVSIRYDSTNFTDAVNRIGRLQSLSFPFFSVKELTITQSSTEKKTAAGAYTINGALVTAKNGSMQTQQK